MSNQETIEKLWDNKDQIDFINDQEAKNWALKNLQKFDIDMIKDANIGKIKKSEKYEDFDPELKKVALSTFALSILFWLTLIFLN